MTEPRREPLPEAPVVPLEYAGLWIAWNRDLTRIVASASTFDEAHDAAVAAGEPRPVLGKAPWTPWIDVFSTGVYQLDSVPVHDDGP
jgi:hypothetical protein